MNQLELIYSILQEVMIMTENMDYLEFGPIFCMIAEEYCKAHNTDVRVFMDDMTSMVYQINEEQGAY